MKNKELTPRQHAYWTRQLHKHNEMMRKAHQAEETFFARARKAGFKKISHPRNVPLMVCGDGTQK